MSQPRDGAITAIIGGYFSQEIGASNRDLAGFVSAMSLLRVRPIKLL